MAITVKIKEKEAKEITFPILMKHKTSDLVVLFTGKRTGFVLNENSTYEVGYYFTNEQISNMFKVIE